MLSSLSKNENSNNIGLYRDDRLSIFRNSGQLAKHKEKLKEISKKFSKIKAYK